MDNAERMWLAWRHSKQGELALMSLSESERTNLWFGFVTGFRTAEELRPVPSSASGATELRGGAGGEKKSYTWRDAKNSLQFPADLTPEDFIGRLRDSDDEPSSPLPVSGEGGE